MARKPPRLRIESSACVLVDVQKFFLDSLGKRESRHILKGTRDLVDLISALRIPLTITLERPVATKGGLPNRLTPPPRSIHAYFEKDFFDLTRERPIVHHLRTLKRKQMIVAGCETDVCILQSCLGLVELGYEVFAVEDLLFSSSSPTSTAIERMRAAGVCFLSFKTLFHELLQAQEKSTHRLRLLRERA